MTTLRPWEEVAPEPLAFPVNGTTYTARSLTMREADQVAALLTGQDPEFADKPAIELSRLLFGDEVDRMIADAVPAAAVDRATTAVLADLIGGRAAAERAWHTPPRDEAIGEPATKKPPATRRPKR